MNYVGCGWYLIFLALSRNLLILHRFNVGNNKVRKEKLTK